MVLFTPHPLNWIHRRLCWVRCLIFQISILFEMSLVTLCVLCTSDGFALLYPPVYLVGSSDGHWWEGDEKGRKKRLDDESVGVRVEGRMEDDGMGGWGGGWEKPGSGRRTVWADGGLLIICEEARAFPSDLDWWQYDSYKCIKKKEGVSCLKYRTQDVVCTLVEFVAKCILHMW